MTVRTITDFRELNKRIVRRPYPIPKISSTLQELEGFTYATTLDLNMGYYAIRLDQNAVEMFTIIFPWGKYSHGVVHEKVGQKLLNCFIFKSFFLSVIAS
jgi:hypothetical protein